MATTYLRLQIYFISSIVVAYIAILAVWFNVDDRLMQSKSEKDFREVIQIRNQVRENLLNASRNTTLNENKLKILRVVSNDWLAKLLIQIQSKRKFQRQRLNDLGVPVKETSGVFISRDKRLYLRSGNKFEEFFGKNWSRDFFSALRHGGRYFSSFMTKFYGRPVTLDEFDLNANKYEILNIRGSHYYCYFSQIENYSILLMIDLDKTNVVMTLNHYLDNLVNSDDRLERYSQDSFVWASQTIYLSEMSSYGLRFTPRRSGWIDFLAAKWLTHILFILFLVFLLGLGGYQILSLRLEFRVLVFVAICFISISSLYRLQHNDNELLKEYLRDNDTRAVANKLSKTLYDNFQRIIKRILTQLDNNKSLDLALPLPCISISADRLGQTRFTDLIGNPILLKAMIEVTRRYHLTRNGFDPNQLSLSDEMNNRLVVDLPKFKSLLAPYIESYILKRLRLIKMGNEAQRYLQFSIGNEDLILFLPGERLFHDDVIHIVCVKTKDFIEYVASKSDWNSHEIALISLDDIQVIFQNFRPRWTKSKIEKFMSNRNLPSTLRSDLNINSFQLKWDQILLLIKTPKLSLKNNSRRDLIVSVLCLMLGFASIFVLRNSLFSWLTQTMTAFNSYRLHQKKVSINRDWFRNEGYVFNNVVEEFIKNIDSRSQQELKMSSALAELILRKKDQFATMAVLEIAFIGISKNDLLDLMNVIENELQRFNGFQVDALAQTIKLCFPLDVDKNGIQNAAETGLALCQFFNEIPNCKFVLILRTGTYELNFSKEDNIEYPLLVIKDFTVQKRQKSFHTMTFLLIKKAIKHYQTFMI